MRFKLFFLISILLTTYLFSDEELHLGITWIGESAKSNQVTQGAIEVLTDLVPSLNIEVQAPLSSKEELIEVTERFSIEKNAMVVLRTSGARFLVENLQSIPTFIGAANNPVQLGVTTNMERPGGNISGVTYQIDYFSVLSLFKQIIPDIETVVLFYDENHPGSGIDRYYTEKACSILSFRYEDIGCRTKEEILWAIRENKNNKKTFIFTNQPIFSKFADEITEAADGISCFSYNISLVESGMLAGMSADNYKLGRVLAGSIISVLFGGKRIGDIPIITDLDPLIAINISTAEKLGITIPIHILKVAEVYK